MACTWYRYGLGLIPLWIWCVGPAWTVAAEVRGRWQCAGARQAVGVLFLEPVPPREFPPPTQPAVMDQRNISFIPRILPIQVGTRVDFPNHDHVQHNVFSPSLTRMFNLGTYPPGEVRSVVFEKPGVVDVFCEIHPDMHAVILVLPTPYFTVTDKKGRFRISAVPPGRYVLKWWSETCGEGVIQELRIAHETDTITVEWTAPVPQTSGGASRAPMRERQAPAVGNGA